MRFKAIMIALLASAAMMATTTSQAQAQSDGVSMPLWVWYVERDAVHLSGGEWTSTYGPYYTYADALAKKEQLDEVRFQGTIGFSEARIYRAINPLFYQPIVRNLVINLPGW